MVTKILDFIHKHLNYKVLKSFFDYPDRFFRNLAETDEKLQFFWSKNREIDFFFTFFITKVSYFVSNMNDDFHEASFEVYYVSVSQKLVILGFSPQIFFILTSVTSDTSWGQTMSLSDLNEVSNFSWRCQLSYETMFVWSVPKLECPETAISQRVILTPPRLLNWPKSPHWLGLKTRQNIIVLRSQ